MCLEIIYLIDIYKNDLVLNNLQLLICHKTINQTKPKQTIWNLLRVIGSNISSTESDSMHAYIVKAWTAIDRLLTTEKSDLLDKIKWEFFQTLALSVLLYDCTFLTLMKSLWGKKLIGNYKNILPTLFKKS